MDGPNKQSLFGLVKDSRTTDLWLYLLLNSDQENKLRTAVNISNMLVGLAGTYAFSSKTVKEAEGFGGGGGGGGGIILFVKFIIKIFAK
jgi:hypothetical protein